MRMSIVSGWNFGERPGAFVAKEYYAEEKEGTNENEYQRCGPA